MGFFRNPEIKRLVFILSAVSVISVAAGFAVGTKAGILIVFVCAVFVTVCIVSARKRYEKIARLNLTIDRVLHGEDYFDFDEFSEGELAVLQSELQKMTVRLREQAEALTKEKSRLSDSIADISHQIRTPLTSINLVLSFLSEPEISNKRRSELVRELVSSVSLIDSLVASLLKMAKIDAGTADFKHDRLLIADVVKRASAPFSMLMDLKNQSLVINCGNTGYEGDLFWSSEAIGNLIKNCTEHTPDGGKIEISSIENAIFTEVIIKDNGKGFCKEDIPKLFERFYKGKNASQNSVGIGLALARMIIEEQNGTIKAENCRNGGAKFSIRFYKTII